MGNPHLAAAILANADGEFFADVAAHSLNGGHFYNGPEGVFLWRPVWSDWPEERLCDPTQADAAGDCWYVWACAGDFRWFLAMGASGLWPVKKFVAFHRRGKARRVSWKQLSRR